MNKISATICLVLTLLLLGNCRRDAGAGSLVSVKEGSSGVPLEPGLTTSPIPIEESGPCMDSRKSFESRETVEQVCQLVNQERSQMKLPNLTLDLKLSLVAQAHAEDMFTRQYFSHTNPEGQSPFDRMRAGGVVFQTAGENIAYWYKTPQEVMNSWMNSSGHKANILNSRYGKIGVGYYKNYWVQTFTN